MDAVIVIQLMMSRDKNMVPYKVAKIAAFVLSAQVLVQSQGHELVPIAD